MDEVKEFELSSGVVLSLRRGSPLAIDNIIKDMNVSDPAPEPPMVYSEGKNREEPNENDPQYKRDVLNWNARLSMRIFTVLVATSTAIKTTPEGMMLPDSDEFNDVLELGGITPMKTSTGRYVQWLQIVAAKKEDTDALGMELLRLAGISEADIAEAEATFRGLQESDTDQDALGRVNGSNGDRVPDEDSRVGV